MVAAEPNKKLTPAKKKASDRSKAFFARRAEQKSKDLKKKAQKKAQAQGTLLSGAKTIKRAKSVPISSVPQNQLAWHRAEIPVSATDVEGTTDEGFWETLHASDQMKSKKGKKKAGGIAGNDSDVWMGLEEVEGVDVVTEDDPAGKRISFVPVEGYQPLPKDKKSEDAAADSQPEADGQDEDAQVPKEPEREASPEFTAFADETPEQPEAEATTEPRTKGSLDDKPTETPVAPSHVPKPETPEESAPTVDDSSLARVNWEALENKDDSDDEGPPEVDLDEWKDAPLHPLIKYGLKQSGFTKPTPIQAGTVGKALEVRTRPAPAPGAAPAKSNGKRKRSQPEEQPEAEEDYGMWHDIVGVAQTGSGKTMAYALPILERLLRQREEQRSNPPSTSSNLKALMGLIICPTRELALQVSDAIRGFVRSCTSYKSEKVHPFASVVSIVGGLSSQKQSRELHAHSGADIIVATPGRLWDVVERDNVVAARMRATRCLVIDEADRVMQDGHFAEMKNILRLLRRNKPAIGEDEERVANAQQVPEAEWGGLQTYIFSATLSAQLQVNLQRRRRGELKKARGTQTLDALMDAIDFRDPDPLVVDLSPRTAVAETVVECKVECLNKDKDTYLYYFLMRYPGRSLVFLNSIDGLRRLQPLLQHLGVPAFSLHSNMQQRQRLKVLDRFKNAVPEKGATAKTAVLLATDVAARGLDLPVVDHVVHYQLPRSADTYVHRSGRTGRAGRTGVALAMAEPKEQGLLRQLLFSLGRKTGDAQHKGAQSNEADLRTLPIEFSLLPQLKERVQLAQEIDKKEHKVKKQSHDDAWIKKLAQDADLEVSDDDTPQPNTKKQDKATSASLKAELNMLLQTPLRLRGVSNKYITSNGLPGFVEDLLANNNVENIPGVRRVRLDQELSGGSGPRASQAAHSKGPKPKRARTSH